MTKETKIPKLNPILAIVPIQAVEQVAYFLEQQIPIHAPSDQIDGWTEVMNALYALANDTDAIVTSPEDLKLEPRKEAP